MNDYIEPAYDPEDPFPSRVVASIRNEAKYQGDLIQWSSPNGKIFIPTGSTTSILEPGFYELGSSDQVGVFFEKIPVKTEGILEFPEAVTQKVVKEIKTFWERESIFRDFSINYRRGIILYGPAGSGKTSTLQLVSRDVIDRGGIVVKFGNPTLFSTALRKFREIQPLTPIVVLMEDIDSIISFYSESEVINILDGVDQMDKIVYLATTNFPELLGSRIMDRPSRFDKKFLVSNPNDQSRKMYFEHLIGGRSLDIDISKWVKDTKEMSLAHLKELFVAVIVLNDPYEDAIATLKDMKSVVSSEDNRVAIGLTKRRSN